MQTARIETLSEADFLQGERRARDRHEYVAGQVFAMGGASMAHNTLAGNVFALLHRHLRGRPCRGFIADMKVRIAARSTYYYPDVVVSCDARDLAAEPPRDYLEHPSLVVEVLSPTTETIDRREKLLAYRELPSLVEYVLVDQERRSIDLYRRVGADWTHALLCDGDTLELASVSLSVPVSEVYVDSGV